MKTYYQYANHIFSIDFPEEIPLLSLQQHLPGICKTNIEKVDIYIDFKDSLEPHLSYNLEHLRVFDIYHGSWLVDMPHLLYSYLKYVLFHKNIYFVHSCMIEDTLFIGHSGSGKTSLCIQALKENLILQSCDRTCVTFEQIINPDNSEVVSHLNVICCTDILSVRKEEKQPILELISQTSDRNIYSVPVSNKHNIDNIKLFHISNSIKQKKITGLSVVHQLYSFFIDNIKSDCFVQDGKIVFSPVYSEKNKKNLFENLKNMVVPVSFVSNILENILQKEEI